jgi:BirA family biotin operon repressor/biotin-[acetyl-CoA-carboxylase] ligase
VTPDIRWYDSVPSTMDIATALASQGAPHGVVVAAHQQTAGRGRRGSTWASPAGAGLYFSFIARPRDARRIPLMTLAAGVGVRDGVRAATGLNPDLKWPNDLLVERKKLAGILAEGHALGSCDEAVVIGVGVNVQPAAYPPDVTRATSIEGELGRAIDRDLLLSEILDGLQHRLLTLSQNPGDILQAWRAASPSAMGTRVEWDGQHGVTAGIDARGALLVKTATGLERIIAGQIHWNL